MTNRDFLVATLRTSEFLEGDTTTDFIERVASPRRLPLSVSDLARFARMAALWIQGENRDRASVWREFRSGWLSSRMPDQEVTVRSGEETLVVRPPPQCGCGMGRLAVCDACRKLVFVTSLRLSCDRLVARITIVILEGQSAKKKPHHTHHTHHTLHVQDMRYRLYVASASPLFRPLLHGRMQPTAKIT